MLSKQQKLRIQKYLGKKSFLVNRGSQVTKILFCSKKHRRKTQLLFVLHYEKPASQEIFLIKQRQKKYINVFLFPPSRSVFLLMRMTTREFLFGGWSCSRRNSHIKRVFSSNLHLLRTLFMIVFITLLSFYSIIIIVSKRVKLEKKRKGYGTTKGYFCTLVALPLLFFPYSNFIPSY